MRFDQAVEAIASMEVRGAAAIGRTAAKALADAAGSYEGDADGFYPYLEDKARELLATRPTAVSLKNALNHVLRSVEGRDGDLEELKASVEDASRAFVQRSNRALDTIAMQAERRIPDGGTVMTHCNSQAALGGIIRAHERGKEVRVVVTESRPLRQGEITIQQLSKAGVPTTFVVDSAAGILMDDVDLVVTGADAVTSQGTVVNKIGTRTIALLAREAGVPFYTCAETYKFHPDTLEGGRIEIEERDPAEVIAPAEVPPGVEVANPVFDPTPARLVDAIITEVGVVHPADAARIIEEHLGGVGPLDVG